MMEKTFTSLISHRINNNTSTNKILHLFYDNNFVTIIIIFGHGKPEKGWNYLKKHIFDDFPF